MANTHSPSPIIAVVVLCLAMLAVYVGCYVLLAEPYPNWPMVGGRLASYRIGGQPAKYFFWPLEQADRAIRRDYWTEGMKTKGK